jgi:F-type H+-transporting ATPase subunit epsilon
MKFSGTSKQREIILPTNTGQMGVLTNHAPLLLDIGVQSIGHLLHMGGFALVKQNQVTVLVNSAESKDKVDAAKSRATLEAKIR